MNNTVVLSFLYFIISRRGLRSYLLGDIDIHLFDASSVIYVDNSGKWQRGVLPTGTRTFSIYLVIDFFTIVSHHCKSSVAKLCVLGLAWNKIENLNHVG